MDAEEDSGAGSEIAAFRQQLKRDNEALYLHLGEFVCLYANVETACHSTFHFQSGLSERVAKAMVGGMRLSDLIGVLSRVIELSNSLAQFFKEDFKACVTQFDHITALRNRLIHRGAQARYGEYVSTNSLTAKTRESVDILKFRLDDLKAASDDCSRIAFRIHLVNFGGDHGQPSDWERSLYAPWRYKPVQPKKTNVASTTKRRSNN
ncbi:MAG TPA: hypothetical protein VJ180_13980 [Pyrinomonadaceae bacterium]|nr:hypothetical protein [Pyrinomonadaceae bacterium]